ncbi:MAG TPA: methyl-accepting chemotaxis protein, partial [Planctomycetota bacterium]|nr:methyl-accepting chemotaxis protein [Planctomycetota bacterium]
MKLGHKIALGFSAVLATGILLGGVAVITMNGSVDRATALSIRYVPKADLAVGIERETGHTMLATRSYGLTGQEKYLTEAKTQFGELETSIANAAKLAAEQKLPLFTAAVAKAKGHADEYAALFRQTEEHMAKLATVYTEMNASAADLVKSTEAYLESQSELMRHELDGAPVAGQDAPAASKGWAKTAGEAEGTAKAVAGSDRLQRFEQVSLITQVITKMGKLRVASWKGQAQRNFAAISDVMPEFDHIDKLLERAKAITRQKEHLDELAAISKDVADYHHDVTEMLVLNKELGEISAKRAEAGNALSDVANAAAEEGLKQSVEEAKGSMDSLKSASETILIGLAVMISTGVLLAYFITRGITRALMRTVTDLTSCSNETASAAEQVAGGAQALADGTSKTAAALEETSASLEEMGSMVKQTAASSSSAATLASEGRQAGERGSQAMVELAKAIQDIKANADQTAKIVKTIDEIAFQTNLLALNAAV